MYVDPLAWRIEEACAAAFPAAERLRVGDWWIARSGGGSRRINAATPAVPNATLDASALAAIEACFEQAALPSIFRIIDLAPAASDLLDTADYAPPEGATRTLVRTTDGVAGSSGTIVTDHPNPSWLAARRHLAPGATDPGEVAARIEMPVGYARRVEGGAIQSVGYAALHDGIAVVEAIGTLPAARRRGHACAIVGTLIDWATQHGAAHIALQVEETNAPARALYAELGFATDLYGYHYRRRAPCPSRG